MLLETAAGQGNALGSATFEELREFRERCKSPGRVAICLDTCHVFAAGYDLSTDRAYEDTFERFDKVLGCGLIKAFHLNDSVKPLGCRVDRHEHVGDGEIGPEAFRRLVNDERFRDAPGLPRDPAGRQQEVPDRPKKLRAKTQNGIGRKRRSRVATPSRGS